jgi:hypothetical protein
MKSTWRRFLAVVGYEAVHRVVHARAAACVPSNGRRSCHAARECMLSSQLCTYAQVRVRMYIVVVHCKTVTSLSL